MLSRVSTRLRIYTDKCQICHMYASLFAGFLLTGVFHGLTDFDKAPG